MNVKESAEVRAAVKFQHNNRAFGPGAMHRTPSPSDERRYAQERQRQGERHQRGSNGVYYGGGKRSLRNPPATHPRAFTGRSSNETQV